MTEQTDRLAFSSLYHCPIYYEDTDFSGFVYHAAYLRLMERGREHLIGISKIRELYARGIHFVVSKIEIKYLAPLSHGDTALVVTHAQPTGGPRINFEQQVFKLPPEQAIPETPESIGKLELATSSTVAAAILEGTKVARLRSRDLLGQNPLPHPNKHIG